jgi:uncharacterized Zn finger protein
MNPPIITTKAIDSTPWWVERWLELLDSYRFKKRLERARIYAREGNVLSIEFSLNGEVKAEIQGSEVDPYQVTMSLSCFTEEDWHCVIETLSEKAIYAAPLLLGEMPQEIEQAFVNNGLSLFPFTLSEVISNCSCPDKANPCKHIGALYYQLAERFAEDPFILFGLRGKTKEQILEGIRLQRCQEIIIQPVQKKNKEIPSDPEAFWRKSEISLPTLIRDNSGTSRTVLDILGRIPLPQEEAEALEIYLKQVYLKLTDN